MANRKIEARGFKKKEEIDLSRKREEIIVQIFNWIKSNSFGAVQNWRWYIGITNNPDARKSGHKMRTIIDPFAFKAFNAGTRVNAKAIETHFHNLGMGDFDGNGGATEESVFVYVFKKRPTLRDTSTIVLEL